MLIAVLALVVCTADVKPVAGQTLEVQQSAKVAPGKYLLPPQGEDGLRGVLRIEAVKGVTLDLTGVELRGVPAGTDLDRCEGYGIVLVGCHDVTLKGGTIGGYRGCVVAQDCDGITLDGVSFDGWYGKHLLSNVAYEDGSDWLYPHHNDKGEWLRDYGAAASLSNCRNVSLHGCRGRRGQNGILLTRCTGGEVWDCDFSFLSGWGLGLYRTSKFVVSHCLFDYCVRGFSDGVYWRGQDSAGILMFERCSENLFAWNSATHGGDGVFLFAGLDTVDEGNAFKRGERDAGGCDDNIWYRNDFSYAVANAIEATFSKNNWVLSNALNGSHQHGIWGGYSGRMVVLGNNIERTLGGAVSIEHGQENAIVENQIEANEIGVELWWDEDKQLVEGVYGQNRDTSSRDTWVYGNAFARNGKDLVVNKTTGLRIGGNSYDSGGDMRMERLKVERGDATSWMRGRDGKTASGEVRDGTLSSWDGKEPEWVRKARAWKCPEVKGELVVFAKDRGETQGLNTIVMGEWGPWDFRSGEPRPKPRLPGGLLKDVRWIGSWWSWRDGPDPREKEREWRALGTQPAITKTCPNWVDPWGGDAQVRKAVGDSHFGMSAVAEFELDAGGKFALAVVSDDGVRLRLDGKTVIEHWDLHAPARDEAQVELTAGKHKLELEYFQIDGAWALNVEMKLVE
ncbi:MAG: right-handed parallel beta-helix repeat-containing protein [Planctomycetes bacterium]|nr:right-handed parallel beta-helix repeat-containing protein [Planctomycetota bacterium]